MLNIRLLFFFIILSFVINKWVTQSSNILSNFTQPLTFIVIFLECLISTITKTLLLTIMLSALKCSQYFDYCRCDFQHFICPKLNKDKTDQTMPSQGKIIFLMAVLILFTYILQSINRSTNREYIIQNIKVSLNEWGRLVKFCNVVVNSTGLKIFS